MPNPEHAVDLLEREHEVERVRAVLRAARQAVGRLLVIEGPPGIGKSRLVEVARERAVELGFRVLHVRGTELEQTFPFGAVRQLFEPVLAGADVADRER